MIKSRQDSYREQSTKGKSGMFRDVGLALEVKAKSSITSVRQPFFCYSSQCIVPFGIYRRAQKEQYPSCQRLSVPTDTITVTMFGIQLLARAKLSPALITCPPSQCNHFHGRVPTSLPPVSPLKKISLWKYLGVKPCERLLFA